MAKLPDMQCGELQDSSPATFGGFHIGLAGLACKSCALRGVFLSVGWTQGGLALASKPTPQMGLDGSGEMWPEVAIMKHALSGSSTLSMPCFAYPYSRLSSVT